MSALSARDEGSVRVLTLRRPPGNALDAATLAALEAEIGRAARDKGARALVLESALPRYFSSGMDLDEIMSRPPAERALGFEALMRCYRALLECPKPVVGAINGAAILGGWILAMGCDWRVMAEESGKAALSEVRLGLSPGAALIRRLSGLASDQRAVKEMVLRGKTLRAPEVLAAGLVDELAPEAETPARALELARKLSKSAPGAFASIKKELNAPFLDEELWRRSLADLASLIGGAEALEGMTAMREKRRARWEA